MIPCVEYGRCGYTTGPRATLFGRNEFGAVQPLGPWSWVSGWNEYLSSVKDLQPDAPVVYSDVSNLLNDQWNDEVHGNAKGLDKNAGHICGPYDSCEGQGQASQTLEFQTAGGRQDHDGCGI